MEDKILLFERTTEVSNLPPSRSKNEANVSRHKQTTLVPVLHPLCRRENRRFPAPPFCFPRVESRPEWWKRCRTLVGYKSSRALPVPPFSLAAVLGGLRACVRSPKW